MLQPFPSNSAGRRPRPRSFSYFAAIVAFSIYTFRGFDILVISGIAVIVAQYYVFSVTFEDSVPFRFSELTPKQ